MLGCPTDVRGNVLLGEWRGVLRPCFRCVVGCASWFAAPNVRQMRKVCLCWMQFCSVFPVLEGNFETIRTCGVNEPDRTHAPKTSVLGCVRRHSMCPGQACLVFSWEEVFWGVLIVGQHSGHIWPRHVSSFCSLPVLWGEDGTKFIFGGHMSNYKHVYLKVAQNT